MNDNIIESVEWHRDQLEKLLSEDDFSKVESELDEVVEKFRLKGSRDKVKRKSKSIKDIISNAFGNKGDEKESPDPGRPPEGDVDERLRNAKRAQVGSRSRSRMR